MRTPWNSRNPDWSLSVKASWEAIPGFYVRIGLRAAVPWPACGGTTRQGNEGDTSGRRVKKAQRKRESRIHLRFKTAGGSDMKKRKLAGIPMFWCVAAFSALLAKPPLDRPVYAAGSPAPLATLPFEESGSSVFLPVSVN